MRFYIYFLYILKPTLDKNKNLQSNNKIKLLDNFKFLFVYWGTHLNCVLLLFIRFRAPNKNLTEKESNFGIEV